MAETNPDEEPKHVSLRDEILQVFGKMRLNHAGRIGDNYCWSAGDLATDLAAELAGLDIVACAMQDREKKSD